MAKVLTFSTKFPAYHPKKGQPTFFVEQIYNSIGVKLATTKKATTSIPTALWDHLNDFVLLDGNMKKGHTIRAGHRFKKGDYFSPRIWSEQPYNSKQIVIAPDMEVKKVWNVEITPTGSNFNLLIDGKPQTTEQINTLCLNDGLTRDEFNNWFSTKSIRDKGFKGQIICWNESINY